MSVVTSFMFPCYLTFFIVFPRVALFFSLKNSFRKWFSVSVLSFIFISKSGFSNTFWLNYITLCIFSTNPWLKAYFRVLICPAYFPLSCKLYASLQHFSACMLSSKNGKPLCKSCRCLGYLTSTSSIYPLSLSSLQHFIEFLSKLVLPFFDLKPPAGVFYDIAHLHRLFTSQYTMYDKSLFWS